MSKPFKATWLGDGDPNAQLVRIGGLSFVKGEAVNVPAENEMAGAIRDNPTFAIDSERAEVVEAVEPEAIDPDTGTEKAALKDEIERLSGKRPTGNPSVDTLRNSLAKLTAQG